VFSKNQPPLNKEYEAAQSNRHGVGALLQASRLRCGKNLHDIAHILRIRYLYLEAIEEERFQDLPGITYAIGFIRTYADHLGLDSEEVVRRFKAEAESKGAKRKNDLFFPIPLPESDIPGGAILFMAVLVAVLAYGGWYVNSSKDGFFAELISPIPGHLNPLTPEEDDPKATDSSSLTSYPQGTAYASDTVVTSGSAASEVTPSADPATQPAPESNQTAAPPALPATEAPATEKPIADAAGNTTPDAPAPAPSEDAPQAKMENAVTEPQLAALPGKASPAIEEKIYGAKEGDSRILLRAKKSSWIQVRDDNSKQLLLTRLLKSGDSYRVPDRPGLRLLAGDAGALEILIDGKPAPSLGAAGAVLRNVALDVDRLREGKAVAE